MESKFHQQILTLTRLSVAQVEEFLALGKPQSIPAKTLLVQVNQKVDQAYFLKKGIIRHFIVGKGQKDFTKNFIQGPRFLLPSLSDFFLNSPSGIYCEALTDLEVICWDRKSIIGFADANPSFYKFLLMGVVKAFKGKEQKEIALNQLEAKERYLRFLKQYPGIANTVALQHIASYLNIRPETLSRIRKNLIS